MRLEVDRETCVGSGNCVLTAQDVFDQDDDGMVLLLEDSPPDAHEVAARDAAARCPSRAIRIVRDR